MSQIIFHIGTPRTGTSTLQKHILRLAKNTYLLSKEAFDSSMSHKGQGNASLNSLKEELEKIDLEKEKVRLVQLLITCIVGTSREDPYPEFIELSRLIIVKFLRHAENQNIFFSSERLCDTSASLQGDSQHTATDTMFGVHSLSMIFSEAAQRKMNICLCLRDPIKYLRSKYLRTAIQRQQTNLRGLSPNEYIHKQTILETHSPGTSALAPAIHSEFLKQLQKQAFVKAFGFKELLASDDVFSLMGLQGQDKYAFRDFPRENNIQITKEQEMEIENEIIRSLKRYGFYERIIKAQVFE